MGADGANVSDGITDKFSDLILVLFDQALSLRRTTSKSITFCQETCGFLLDGLIKVCLKVVNICNKNTIVFREHKNGQFLVLQLKRFTLGFLVFGLYWHGSAIAAGDIEAVANKVSMCVGCHGIPIIRLPFENVGSRIAGQKVEYLVSALKAYRGSKKSPRVKQWLVQ